MFFILLCYLVFISKSLSQKCETGNTYYFKYNDDGLQNVQFVDRCQSAQLMQKCNHVSRMIEKYHPTLGVRPFDQFAEAYIRCFVENWNQPGKKDINWIDLYGHHSILKTERYYGHKLRAVITDIKYETPKQISKSVDSLLVKTFTNAQPTEVMTGEVNEEISKTTESTKSRQHDWNVGASVEVGASDLFNIFSVSVEVSVEYSGSSTSDVTTTSTRTYNIKDKVTVPANTTMRMMWTMTEQNVKLSWTSKMQMSGLMAASINNELWFFPVGEMANVYPEYFTRTNIHTLDLKAQGEFFTTTAIESAAYVNQFPLGQEPACTSS